MAKLTIEPSLCTWMGKRFFPADPRVVDVHVGDIAHALSNMPRFAGHTKRFYSVAQHSVAVSHACGPVASAYGLLHDASEAYLMDMPRPLKQLFPEYKNVEDRLQAAIYEAFGLSPDAVPQSVKEADEHALRDEQRWLMQDTPWWQKREVVPMEFGPARVMDHDQARDAFLRRARWLHDRGLLPRCPGLEDLVELPS